MLSVKRVLLRSNIWWLNIACFFYPSAPMCLSCRIWASAFLEFLADSSGVELHRSQSGVPLHHDHRVLWRAAQWQMSHPASGNLVQTHNNNNNNISNNLQAAFCTNNTASTVDSVQMFSLCVSEQENKRDTLHRDQALSGHYDSFRLSTLLSVPPAPLLHDWKNGEMFTKTKIKTTWNQPLDI